MAPVTFNPEDARKEMVSEQLFGRGIRDERVLWAFEKVPRHLFVREEDQARAYGDHPLVIGNGQTISQPYMVAYMLERLGLEGAERVLEVGTGSGFETALLAELSSEVYTIERVPSLLDSARERLRAFGYQNLRFRLGDGAQGWPEAAPFDRIIISAAAPSVPAPLVDQIASGGVMILPVGTLEKQEVIEVRRTAQGISQQTLCGCVFVRLIGPYGWPEE